MTDEIRFPVHPLTGLRMGRRLPLLLLLPLLRAVTAAESLPRLVWSEAVLAAALTALALVRQSRIRLSVGGGVLRLRQGLLVTRRVALPVAALRAVRIEKSPGAALLGAEKITLDAGGGRAGRPDFVLYLPRKAEGAFLEALALREPSRRLCRARRRAWLLTALSEASALSGLLVAASLLRRGGRLLEQAGGVPLADTLTRAAVLLRRWLPPATAVLALILVSVFALSLLLSLRRNAGFSVWRGRRILTVRQGLWTQTTTRYPAVRPPVLVLEHPPLLSLLGRYAVRLGIAQARREQPLLLPSVRGPEEAALGRLALGGEPAGLTHPVPRSAERRARRAPQLWMGALAAVTLTGCGVLPSLRGLIAPVGLMGLAVLAYWLRLRLRHARQGGVSLGRWVRVVGLRRLTLVDGRFPLAEVDCVTLTQGPLDRRWGLGTLTVRQRAKDGFTVRCPNLAFDDLLAALSETA